MNAQLNQDSRSRMQKKQLLVSLASLVAFFYLFYTCFSHESKIRSRFNNADINSSSVCSIPEILMNAKFIVKSLQTVINCSKKQLCGKLFHFDWTKSTLTLKAETSLNVSAVHCKYATFSFDNRRMNLTYGRWNTWRLKEALIVDVDFLQLKCFQGKRIVCNTVYFGFGSNKLDRSSNRNGNQYNVGLLVLDNMSRFMFELFLEKSFNLLNGWNYSSLFHLHHKVGPNSPPNMASILTGLPYANNEKFVNIMEAIESNRNFSDFIFKFFDENGYKTYFLNEERPEWYLNSNLSKLINQHSFDYNWWPFFRHFSEENWLNQYECIADTPRINQQLRHILEFTRRFSDKKLFFYTHIAELTHNEPTTDAKKLDNPLVQLLNSWKSDGFLNSTVLFILGDHGTRYLRKRGLPHRLQENLPLLYVILPQNFVTTYPEIATNVKTNQFKVTSQYDIHATLLNLLELNEKKKITNEDEIGRSLFEDLGKRESCSDANIPETFCSCLG